MLTSRNQTNPYSEDSSDHHAHNSSRMKQGSKRKRRSKGSNGVKTSTPKMNPGGRLPTDTGLEMDEDVGSINDHQATIRELVSVGVGEEARGSMESGRKGTSVVDLDVRSLSLHLEMGSSLG